LTHIRARWDSRIPRELLTTFPATVQLNPDPILRRISAHENKSSTFSDPFHGVDLPSMRGSTRVEKPGDLPESTPSFALTSAGELIVFDCNSIYQTFLIWNTSLTLNARNILKNNRTKFYIWATRICSSTASSGFMGLFRVAICALRSASALFFFSSSAFFAYLFFSRLSSISHHRIHQVNRKANDHIPNAAHKLASNKTPLCAVRTSNDIVEMALIPPEIADVVINAVTKRKKAAAPANTMHITCKFRACCQSKITGKESSNAMRRALTLSAMLKTSRGGDRTEFVSDLAKPIVMSGSAFGASTAAFVEQATAVELSLRHIPNYQLKVDIDSSYHNMMRGQRDLYMLESW